MDIAPCNQHLSFKDRKFYRPQEIYPTTFWQGRRTLTKNLQFLYCFFVGQSLSHVQFFATSWTAAHQASLSSTISQSLLKLMSIESVMLSNISSSTARFSSCPQSFPASGSFFSNELALRIRGPKYWSFSISPPNEYLGLISFWIDWFDLPAVQETLKSLF